MARGESDERSERGIGLAIFSVFLVVCALVAWLVADRPPPPPAPTTPVRAAEQRAALTSIHSRGCAGRTESGLAVGARPAPEVALDHELRARGYVPIGDAWSEPLELPLLDTRAEGLEGACGLVAVAGESASITESGPDVARLERPCFDEAVTIPVCGVREIEAQGWGPARTRVYAMPGLDEGAAEASGLPVAVLLAHAEAELQLARAGWRPSPTVWHTPQPAGVAPRTPPPPAASDPCEPWVVVGVGVGGGRSELDGEVIAIDRAPQGFTLGVISCPATAGTSLDLDSSRPGDLYWRRYAVGSARPSTAAPLLGVVPRQVDAIADLEAP